jgi:hypothetical protein
VPPWTRWTWPGWPVVQLGVIDAFFRELQVETSFFRVQSFQKKWTLSLPRNTCATGNRPPPCSPCHWQRALVSALFCASPLRASRINHFVSVPATPSLLAKMSTRKRVGTVASRAAARTSPARSKPAGKRNRGHFSESSDDDRIASVSCHRSFVEGQPEV